MQAGGQPTQIEVHQTLGIVPCMLTHDTTGGVEHLHLGPALPTVHAQGRLVVGRVGIYLQLPGCVSLGKPQHRT